MTRINFSVNLARIFHVGFQASTGCDAKPSRLTTKQSASIVLKQGLRRGAGAALIVSAMWTYAEDGALVQDCGFLYSRGRSIENEHRIQAAGPFFESRINAQQDRYIGLRPFWSRVQSAQDGRVLHDVLWPVAMKKSRAGDVYWRVLCAFGHRFEPSDAGASYRVALMPVFFWGRDKAGESYVAAFPLGGRIRGFLFFDQIDFALFPLYVKTRQSHIHATSLFWPLLSWAHGQGVQRFRFFPFYGHSHRESRWTKRFVMWPFWTSVRYHDDVEQGGGFVLFPLFGRIHLADQKTWWLLPPLFRWSCGDQEQLRYLPWPFVQYRKGTVDQLYLWPIWGNKKQDGDESGFFIWPIVHHRNKATPEGTVQSFRLLPFLTMTTTKTKPLDVGAGLEEDPAQIRARAVKLWPLFRYRRADDAWRVHVAALWPAKEVPPIERNLSPLWTIFQAAGTEDAYEQEFLWGLQRYTRSAGQVRRFSLFPLIEWTRAPEPEAGVRWQVLRGLVGYHREGLRNSMQLLYFLRWNFNRGQVDDHP